MNTYEFLAIRRSTASLHAAFLLTLMSAVFLAYSNNFNADFVYDDYPFIVYNPAVRDLSNPTRFFVDRESFSEKGEYVIYRPLVALSFALNYRLNDGNPAPFHAVNIALHAACGLVLYWFLCLTFGDSLFSFFASLLFTLHPVQTEAVSWISGRGNPMFLLFLLLAMICYRKWSTTARGSYYILSLVFAVLSLLAKEMAVVLPVLLVVYDFFVNRPLSGAWKRRLLAVLPFFAFSLLYVATRHLVLGVTQQIGYWGGSPWTAFLTMTKGVVYYLRLMFVPRPLMVEYMMPLAYSLFQTTVMLSILIILSIAGVWVVSCRREPLIAFGIAWFFASLIPVSNVVPLQAIINERFLYLPSIGFAVILAFPLLMRQSLSRRAAGAALAALSTIALCYGLLTFDRNRDWRDSLSLWTASVRDSPAGPTSRYNLGLELYNRGRYVEAVEHLQLACRLQERFPSAHGALGNTYFALGKLEDAIREYEVGLSQAPDDDRMRRNLAVAWYEKGKAHANRGEINMAVNCLLTSLRYNPNFEPAKEAFQELQLAKSQSLKSNNNQQDAP